MPSLARAATGPPLHAQLPCHQGQLLSRSGARTDDYVTMRSRLYGACTHADAWLYTTNSVVPSLASAATGPPLHAQLPYHQGQLLSRSGARTDDYVTMRSRFYGACTLADAWLYTTNSVVPSLAR